MKRIKQKVTGLLLVVVFILYSAIPVLNVQAADTVLKIDHTHKYTGMDKSFQDGYSPVISNNRVSVTVPFLAAEALQDQEVYGKVIFEKGSDSPFVQKNYQKTVRKQTYLFEKETDAYVFQLNLPLTEDRKNGQYPLYLEMGGVRADGTAFTQVFTIYISITDGQAEAAIIDNEEPEAGEDGFMEEDDPGEPGGYSGGDGEEGGSREAPEAIKHQPKLMLDSWEVEGGQLQTGENFTVRLAFRNMRTDASIYNIKVMAACEAAEVLFDKTSFYIEAAAGGAVSELTMTGTVSRDCEISNARISFSLEYEDAEAQAITESDALTLQIRRDVRVEAGALQIPDTVYASETIQAVVQVNNLSRSQVYNVRLELEMPGMNPVGSLFIGNMEAGSSEEGTVNIYIGTLDSGGEKYGKSAGTYTLFYEDEFGEEYQEVYDCSVTINEPEVLTASFKADETETQSQWWITILVCAVILAGIIAVPVVKLLIRQRGLVHGGA